MFMSQVIEGCRFLSDYMRPSDRQLNETVPTLVQFAKPGQSKSVSFERGIRSRLLTVNRPLFHRP
jgi:hypothetical protein